MKKVNSYNIFEEENYSTILYHALAHDEEEVKSLAKEAGFDISGMVIELERTNVKDQLGRPYESKIEDAQVY